MRTRGTPVPRVHVVNAVWAYVHAYDWTVGRLCDKRTPHMIVLQTTGAVLLIQLISMRATPNMLFRFRFQDERSQVLTTTGLIITVSLDSAILTT